MWHVSRSGDKDISESFGLSNCRMNGKEKTLRAPSEAQGWNCLRCLLVVHVGVGGTPSGVWGSGEEALRYKSGIHYIDTI